MCGHACVCVYMRVRVHISLIKMYLTVIFITNIITLNVPTSVCLAVSNISVKS